MAQHIQLRRGLASLWTSTDPTLAEGEVGLETDTGLFKFGDGLTAWTSLPYSAATVTEILDIPTAETDDTLVLAPDGLGGVEFRAETGGGGGLTDPPTVTYIDGTGAAAPADPASGDARLYAKTDGRWYSRDSAGVEYGPFDAAGGGGGLYAVDELFPGSSLPADWTFTGSGSCVVSGGKALITSGAQSDRLMFAHTCASLTVVRAHLKNITGTGGMPSLCAFDAAGNGGGVGPYVDGFTYGWQAIVTGYQYNGTNVQVDSATNVSDVWLELMINGGQICGAGYSTDGVTWIAKPYPIIGPYTITQFGIVQLYTAANITAELWELQISEP